jgi:Zn-dependent peptidase ImmA (M78 family)/transcriptional regulator with XRE-family HTH domain
VIHGERVRRARLWLKENQTEFARAVGIDQPRLSQLERGTLAPADLVTSAISVHTGFPVAWFERAPSTPIPVGSLLFRARTSLRAADREQAVECAQIVWEQAERMRSLVAMPVLRLPDLGGVEPRVAAGHVREALGLPPHGPVANLVHAVEKAGVLVLALPLPYERHDAFSTWCGEGERRVPLVALLAEAPGDRRRFSVAHELGHLALHRDIPASMSRLVEPEADVFASALLVPLDDLADELRGRPTLNHFVMLKRRWGVSLQVLIRAARTIRVVDEDRYVSLFKQLSARGWRKDQPIEVTLEKPRAYRKMAELIYGDPVDVRALARDAAWLPPFAQAVLDQHARVADVPRAAIRPPNVVELAHRRTARRSATR